MWKWTRSMGLPLVLASGCMSAVGTSESELDENAFIGDEDLIREELNIQEGVPAPLGGAPVPGDEDCPQSCIYYPEGLIVCIDCNGVETRGRQVRGGPRDDGPPEEYEWIWHWRSEREEPEISPPDPDPPEPESEEEEDSYQSQTSEQSGSSSSGGSSGGSSGRSGSSGGSGSHGAGSSGSGGGGGGTMSGGHW